jgi:cyclopropane-fatty-acyl-phospholipid synthase
MHTTPGFETLAGGAIRLAETGWLPDATVRRGIRALLRRRLADETRGGVEGDRGALLATLRASPIALETEAANAQHYEVPADFFRLVLGPRRKYSACWFEPGDDLARAEQRMLALCCERAGIEDGMRVLDLGCGWGSLTLWLAERYPRASVLAVSNSKSQREHVLGECARRGFGNVEVVTADANRFEPERRFDRVVSIEMFEHLRNWERMLARVARWLEPDGRAFLHVFCHRTTPYLFEDRGASDWMARHFFTGGLMPSADLIDAFDRDLAVEERWFVNGRHYARTSEAWLCNLDAARERAFEVLAAAHGPREAARQLRRWRLFFLACAELFAFGGGAEWLVAHYRLAPARGRRS